MTLGIVGEMAKAGLVNDNSVGFAGRSKNTQRTVIAVVYTPKPTTLNPILTIQRTCLCIVNTGAAEVLSSTTIPPTTPLDCRGGFREDTPHLPPRYSRKIQDVVTITGIFTFVHYYSPDSDATVNV